MFRPGSRPPRRLPGGRKLPLQKNYSGPGFRHGYTCIYNLDHTTAPEKRKVFPGDASRFERMVSGKSKIALDFATANWCGWVKTNITAI
jgi:hypothetical protein